MVKGSIYKPPVVYESSIFLNKSFSCSDISLINSGVAGEKYNARLNGANIFIELKKKINFDMFFMVLTMTYVSKKQ